VALAAAAAGLGNEFTQDDVGLIFQNSRVHQLSNWRDVITSPYWPPAFHQELYRPLTSLFHAAQFDLGGGIPLVFRVTSYLLYALVSVGVFLLAGRLVARPAALAAALLFAAHPVHVEAVALGVGQSELLVGLLAVCMTIRYLDARRRGALAARDWAILGVLYLAACLTKEQGMLLPLPLLAAELFLLQGAAAQRARLLWKGFGVLAGIAVLVVLARRAVLQGQFAGVLVAEAIEGLDVGGRALTMLQVVPEWARLLLWPAHLQADYAPQEIVASSWFGPREALGFLLLAGTATAAWAARKRAPVFSFGIAWTAIALIPVSNVLVPTGIVLAERTLFLPSLGVVIAMAGLVGAMWPRLAGAPWQRRALEVACAALVTAGVIRSGARHRDWRDTATLTVSGAEDAPRSYRAQLAYGYHLFESGQRDRALETYELAWSLAPRGHGWRIRNDLARRFFGAREPARAVEQLRASLAEAPERPETWNYLILGLLELGEYAEGGRMAEDALARGAEPAVFRDLRNLADSAARVGAPPGSIRVRVVLGPPPSQ
jgi:tetratricopeptide (TPR) repeat protein